jgi:glycosyltransferase involved in cell wall biosynthesis
MAHGLPVIATLNCGDVVQNGENGWVIKSGSPGELTSILERIAEDPDSLTEMSESATERVADFSLSRLEAKLIKLTQLFPLAETHRRAES